MALSKKNILLRLFQRIIPTRIRTIISPRAEPDSIASQLDVDLVHSVLEEAKGGNMTRLFGLYRDMMANAHLQTEFGKRKMAVLGEDLTLHERHEGDKECTVACDGISQLLDEVPEDQFFNALNHLLDSTLWPVALVEKVYRPVPVNSESGKFVKGATVGFVGAGPQCRIICWISPAKVERCGWKISIQRMVNGWARFIRWMKNRYMVHRGHLLKSFPDTWGGPMRAALFWYLFAGMGRDWWARFLDRFGAPFIVGKYDSADDRSRMELGHAFSQATKLFGLVVPKSAFGELTTLLAENTFPPLEKSLFDFGDYSSSKVGKQTLVSLKSRVYFVVSEQNGILEVIILPR